MVEPVCRSFWLRSWSQDKDVHKPEDIVKVGEAAGLNEGQMYICLENMNTDEIKDKLKVCSTNMEK